MIADGGSRMDLTFLHAAEREIVLEVLQRDKVLRSIEENRIRSASVLMSLELLGQTLTLQCGSCLK